jgi:hypothetical protein
MLYARTAYLTSISFRITLQELADRCSRDRAGINGRGTISRKDAAPVLLVQKIHWQEVDLLIVH